MEDSYELVDCGEIKISTVERHIDDMNLLFVEFYMDFDVVGIIINLSIN